jgi:hypothetical protein
LLATATALNGLKLRVWTVGDDLLAFVIDYAVSGHRQDFSARMFAGIAEHMRENEPNSAHAQTKTGVLHGEWNWNYLPR